MAEDDVGTGRLSLKAEGLSAEVSLSLELGDSIAPWPVGRDGSGAPDGSAWLGIGRMGRAGCDGWIGEACGGVVCRMLLVRARRWQGISLTP